MELVIHGNAATVKNDVPGNGWSVVETGMYSNPKAVGRVQESLAKINLQGVVNIMFDEYAAVALTTSYENEIAHFKSMMVPGQINMFVRNNSGSANRHNPLTPWILMHRLHHSYELSGYKFLNNQKRELSTGDIIIDVENEIREILGVKRTRKGGEAQFFALACTMRSARVGQLYPFCLDVAAELFAQFHITGDIKFKPFDDWKILQWPGSSWASNFDFTNRKDGKFLTFQVVKNENVNISDAQKEAINAIIQKYKPLLVGSIKYETELMKTIPNII